MARLTSEKVGRGPCPDCGEAVMYRKSSGGMLTHKCDHCDSSGYAVPGGDAYTKRMKLIKPATPDAAPEPVLLPKGYKVEKVTVNGQEVPFKETPPPTPPAKKGGFALDQL